MSHPTDAERFFFDNNGYLVLEEFLSHELTDHLTKVLQEVIQRRRSVDTPDEAKVGRTQIQGEDTRTFYLLDDDPAFLDMVDYPPIWPYVTGLLNEYPHHHASDAIEEIGISDRPMGWHLDGHDDGYRNLGNPIPLLQLKIGYYLSDMSNPGQGNLCVVPGSHKACHRPEEADLASTDLFAGAIEVCGPPGTAILFHNALWHSAGPRTREQGRRIMLYYAYEHPWMVASQEHWGYDLAFYNKLAPNRHSLFHGFVFDPPENRWR
ncbi:MAG: hypothetical protein HOH43_17045 [Candidatus Latescibacteria bacterium]|nr:hypothetical protein [Candidatus Latescibacterota bacterium]